MGKLNTLLPALPEAVRPGIPTPLLMPANKTKGEIEARLSRSRSSTQNDNLDDDKQEKDDQKPSGSNPSQSSKEARMRRRKAMREEGRKINEERKAKNKAEYEEKIRKYNEEIEMFNKRSEELKAKGMGRISKDGKFLNIKAGKFTRFRIDLLNGYPKKDILKIVEALEGTHGIVGGIVSVVGVVTIFLLSNTADIIKNLRMNNGFGYKIVDVESGLLSCNIAKITKRTRKVGIVGTYGTPYGASPRKQIKKMKVSHHNRYFCEFYGKYAVKRKTVGIWDCKDRGKVKEGGAYPFNTFAAITVRAQLEG
ncbi:hypothetical protein AgCh_008609 [Apium graveolens]